MCIGYMYFSRLHVAIKLNVGQRKTKEREREREASIYTKGKICSNVEELKIVVNKRTNK